MVAILLIATLIYVRRFSKHITAIRDSRGEFEKLIGDLTKSTDQAASHLHQFKVTAEVAGRDLQARVERTQGLTTEFGKIGEDLKLLTERAESAANRLEAAIAKAGTSPRPARLRRLPRSSPRPRSSFPEEEDDRKVSSLSALSGLR